MTNELDPVEEMIGRPLEQMAPAQVARYISLYQREANSISLVDPPTHRETAIFKSLQREYGADHVAALIRHVFLKNGGRMEVRKGEYEYIAHRHFTTAMRWWTDRLNIELQAKVERKSKVSERFVFSKELW